MTLHLSTTTSDSGTSCDYYNTALLDTKALGLRNEDGGPMALGSTTHVLDEDGVPMALGSTIHVLVLVSFEMEFHSLAQARVQ